MYKWWQKLIYAAVIVLVTIKICMIIAAWLKLMTLQAAICD